MGMRVTVVGLPLLFCPSVTLLTANLENGDFYAMRYEELRLEKREKADTTASNVMWPCQFIHFPAFRIMCTYMSILTTLYKVPVLICLVLEVSAARGVSCM